MTPKINAAAITAAVLFSIVLKAGNGPIRPSSVPLVTVDPYFSIWSPCDNAYDGRTVHWTGHPNPLLASVMVDGKVYRVLGKVDPDYRIILPTITEELWSAPYMTVQPSGDWVSPEYDDSGWQYGPGAFGSYWYPVVRTEWVGDNTDIWVRRSFNLDEKPGEDSRIVLTYSHDDTFELYINGKKVVDTGYSWRNDVELELSREAVSRLREGVNVIAAHCSNAMGGSYVDFGLKEVVGDGRMTDAAEQVGLRVNPTDTDYTFRCGDVVLTMTFTAPLMMNNLDRMSSPVNYVTFEASSTDRRSHDVRIYFDASPEIAMGGEAVPVTCLSGCNGDVRYVMAGTDTQNVLSRCGDDVRIDWGWFYLASADPRSRVALGTLTELRDGFASTGDVPAGERRIHADNIRRTPLGMCLTANLGKVGKKPVSTHFMLAYDDVRSIRYFGTELAPYWNRNGGRTLPELLSEAETDYCEVMGECRSFDKDLVSSARKSGGSKYADLCALAYRQAVAAHKLVESPDGELLFFSKECFSNGSIGTVDITYPSSPMFLLYNAELVKAMMNPIFHYCESGMWHHPFAAHDVGTYPWAEGQTYNGHMPVEESGNMLILAAAISRIDGNAEYAMKHWETLRTWADYLLSFGLDPAEQLCTDDFAGHLAHNANLSVKAILGVASFGMMAGLSGDDETAGFYLSRAARMAGEWKEMAADGDHYSLTFDRKGTWSQKYNLVWDDVLGLDLFDDSIDEDETAYYLSRMNRYGLPLDCRRNYTKTDWIMWTASMSPNRKMFERFVSPVWDFYDETVDRVPMSDWTNTMRRRHEAFQARSVVGGFYMKMLSDHFRKLSK